MWTRWTKLFKSTFLLLETMDASWTEKGYSMVLLKLAQQIGVVPKWVAGTAGGEYHSACPSCGGIDRFYIQPHRPMNKCLGYYCCRQCGINGDTIQFARQFLNYSFQEAAHAINPTILERITPTFNSSHIAKPALQKPPIAWIAKATEFVAQAHENLLHNEPVLADLASRGLPLAAVQRYKLGWSEQNEFFQRESWGLVEEIGRDGNSRPLWIPSGLVIPTVQPKEGVIRLKVRRYDWKIEDKLPKYIAISGSMNGLNLIGSLQQSTIVVVESELDAYAIDYATHDFICAIAVGSNIKNPDNLTDRLVKNVKDLLICHDNDEAGQKMLIKWQRLYPHAIGYPTPIGKDIGEAIQKGFDIREWLSGFI